MALTPTEKNLVGSMLEGFEDDDITIILQRWLEVVRLKNALVSAEDVLRTKIKVYLKERKWNHYRCKNSKVSVRISTRERVDVDRSQLKLMLTESQLAQVLRKKSFEVMNIIKPEDKEKLKNFTRSNKLFSLKIAESGGGSESV